MQLLKFSLVKLLRWKPAILHVLARYYAHSVFLPKQESSKFDLKTTTFTTPLFSTNDHLLGSSFVIFLKILGRFNAELMPCQKVLKMTCGRCAVFAESASCGRLHSFSSSQPLGLISRPRDKKKPREAHIKGIKWSFSFPLAFSIVNSMI